MAVDVYPQNHDAARLFFQLDTQWHCAGMDGLRTGLIYASVSALMELLEIIDKRSVFEKIQIMENEVLTVLQERAVRA